MVRGVKEAIMDNKKAVKIYIANCSTERTQTCHFSIMDHIKEIQRYGGEKIVDYCLVNNNVIRTSKNEAKLGEINNITTDDEEAEGAAIVKADVIDKENPLLHDKTKLAKSIVELYNKAKSVKV